MKAVILAGGEGRRLEPYTHIIPKPLVPIDDRPILDIVIKQLKRHGFNHLILAVGHLSELIMAVLGDGSKYEINIEYSKEKKPLGTAGPLYLLKDKLKEPFLVLNGDTLSTINFSELIEFHKKNDCIVTIVLAKKQVYIDLGIIELDENNNFKDYIEKPTFEYLVSSGIYIFDPKAISYLKEGAKIDFPDFIKRLVKNGEKIGTYLSDYYWLDIGRREDYEQAVNDFQKMKHLFLPDE